MSFNVELSLKAQRELNEAWNWYEDELIGLGDRFEQEFFRKIEIIQNSPLLYAVKNRKREVMTDSFPYLIVYRTSKRKNQILIISVFHMKRHPKKKR